MNHAKRAAATAATAAIIATAGVAGATSASAADNCPPGQEQVAAFGKTQCGTVTEIPDPPNQNQTGETGGQADSTTSSVTPSVGVILRDDNGALTTSGLSNRDQFEYLGEKMDGKHGDGTLIKIRQTSTGMGGWGELREGWIPVKYTQLPTMFD
jgi:hypothetical protein